MNKARRLENIYLSAAIFWVVWAYAEFIIGQPGIAGVCGVLSLFFLGLRRLTK